MREFDNETLKVIEGFENITGSQVRDCLCNDNLYFLVSPGKAGQAIGKGGENIKAAERMFKKHIKIYEFAEDTKQFIRNLIPAVQKIELNGQRAVVSINNKERGAVIGRDGSNIKILREFLERNSDLKELKVV